MATTYEEAVQCPKCGQPGEVTQKRPARDRRGKRVEAHIVTCRNQLCRWLNTNWVVQVNEDGSIPEPYSALGPKAYPALSPESETRVKEAMQAQLDMETKPGGAEIRNPRA